MCRCGSLMEESDLVALTPLQHVWPYCVHNLLHHHQNHHKNHHHNHHHNHHQNHHHRQMYEDWCCVTHKKLSVHPCYCFNFIAIGKTCQEENCFPFSPTAAKDSLAWTLSPWKRPVLPHRPNKRPPGSTNLPLPVPPGLQPCFPNKRIFTLSRILHIDRLLREGLLYPKPPFWHSGGFDEKKLIEGDWESCLVIQVNQPKCLCRIHPWP